MRFPSIFVNHGGGPLPLLGRQPALAQHMKEVRTRWLPQDIKPDAIVVVSAHWESDKIQISSGLHPSMLYDYSGFPPESYEYQYPAPGSPTLARTIQKLLNDSDLECELNDQRGFDHGVFVPLMLMFPEADIPVVAVSLHSSLSSETHLALGRALQPLLRGGDGDPNILLLGSGYAFHNMHAFFHPTKESLRAASDFNQWLQETFSGSNNVEERLERLRNWERLAPGARIAHPREEHLLPLLVVAAAAAAVSDEPVQVIFDSSSTTTSPSDNKRGVAEEHAVSSFLFP